MKKEPKWIDSIGGRNWQQDYEEEYNTTYNEYNNLWSRKLLEEQERLRKEDFKRKQEIEMEIKLAERKKINNEQFIRFCKEHFPNTIFAFMMDTGIEL